MSARPPFSVQPDPAFAEALESMLVAELQGGADAASAEPTSVPVITGDLPGRGAGRRPRRTALLVAAVVAVCVGGAALAWFAAAGDPTEPVISVPPPAVTTTTTPTTQPEPLKVPDGALAAGEYTAQNLVVPLRFRVDDDGWSRVLAQRRVLMLQRSDMTVALTIDVVPADTPQGVVDYACRGGVTLGAPTDGELFGSPSSRAAGSVAEDCTFAVCTELGRAGCLFVVPAGSQVTVVTAELDGQQVAAIVSTSAPLTADQSERLDALLGSVAPL